MLMLHDVFSDLFLFFLNHMEAAWWLALDYLAGPKTDENRDGLTQTHIETEETWVSILLRYCCGELSGSFYSRIWPGSGPPKLHE